MRLKIYRSKPRRVEYEIVYEEEPTYVGVCHEFTKNIESNCSGHVTCKLNNKSHLITLPVGTYIHPLNENVFCNYCGDFYDVKHNSVDNRCNEC